MSTKLFVGNLDFKVTENDLRDAFAARGTVVEAKLATDRTTGRPRGFGFVTMSTPEEVGPRFHTFFSGHSRMERGKLGC